MAPPAEGTAGEEGVTVPGAVGAVGAAAVMPPGADSATAALLSAPAIGVGSEERLRVTIVSTMPRTTTAATVEKPAMGAQRRRFVGIGKVARCHSTRSIA